MEREISLENLIASKRIAVYILPTYVSITVGRRGIKRDLQTEDQTFVMSLLSLRKQ